MALTRRSTRRSKTSRNTDENQLRSLQYANIDMAELNAQNNCRSAGAQVFIKQSNFLTNKKNAVKKKQNAADRENMFDMYWDIKNNCLVAECQAGLYELLRHASLSYFTNFSHAGFQVEIDIDKDMQDLIVQAKYMMKYTSSGNTTYCVHMYHTKSKMMIQGGGLKRFVEDDLPNILSLIKTANRGLHLEKASALNKQIRRYLCEASAFVADNNSSKKPTLNGKQNHPQKSDDVHVNSYDPPPGDTAGSGRAVTGQASNNSTSPQIPDVPPIAGSTGAQPVNPTAAITCTQPVNSATVPLSSQTVSTVTTPHGTQPVNTATVPPSTQPAETVTVSAGSQPVNSATVPSCSQTVKTVTAPSGTQPVNSATVITSTQAAKIVTVITGTQPVTSVSVPTNSHPIIAPPGTLTVTPATRPTSAQYANMAALLTGTHHLNTTPVVGGMQSVNPTSLPVLPPSSQTTLTRLPTPQHVNATTTQPVNPATAHTTIQSLPRPDNSLPVLPSPPPVTAVRIQPARAAHVSSLGAQPVNPATVPPAHPMPGIGDVYSADNIQNIRKRSLDLDAREKKLKTLESTLERRERELNKRQAQHETAKANIACLETRLRDILEENRILKLKIENLTHETRHQPNHNNQQPLPTPGTHAQAPHGAPTQEYGESYRHLHDRLEYMERRMMDQRMKEMENQVLNSKLQNLENLVMRAVLHEPQQKCQHPVQYVPFPHIPYPHLMVPNHMPHPVPYDVPTHHPNGWHPPAGEQQLVNQATSRGRQLAPTRVSQANPAATRAHHHMSKHQATRGQPMSHRQKQTNSSHRDSHSNTNWRHRPGNTVPPLPTQNKPDTSQHTSSPQPQEPPSTHRANGAMRADSDSRRNESPNHQATQSQVNLAISDRKVNMATPPGVTINPQQPVLNHIPGAGLTAVHAHHAMHDQQSDPAATADIPADSWCGEKPNHQATQSQVNLATASGITTNPQQPQPLLNHTPSVICAQQLDSDAASDFWLSENSIHQLVQPQVNLATLGYKVNLATPPGATAGSHEPLTDQNPGFTLPATHAHPAIQHTVSDPQDTIPMHTLPSASHSGSLKVQQADPGSTRNMLSEITVTSSSSSDVSQDSKKPGRLE